ncbi:hypothetical protein [Sphingobium yanoikuyae]|uniref:hypothetical protein n=1 Tax=Sphingobium yanoikuyae TaxID=13690 RepID=UPI0012377E44|nr:hypothetical protein [Sphingobium yanoikuyae]
MPMFLVKYCPHAGKTCFTLADYGRFQPFFALFSMVISKVRQVIKCTRNAWSARRETQRHGILGTANCSLSEITDRGQPSVA